MSSLFQEKQAELQSAVVRVDQVTPGGDRKGPWEGGAVSGNQAELSLSRQGPLSSLCECSHQLSQQLEDLRRGRLQLHPAAPAQGPHAGSQGATAGQRGSPLSGPAALELRKLYQELQVNYSIRKT